MFHCFTVNFQVFLSHLYPKYADFLIISIYMDSTKAKKGPYTM